MHAERSAEGTGSRARAGRAVPRVAQPGALRAAPLPPAWVPGPPPLCGTGSEAGDAPRGAHLSVATRFQGRLQAPGTRGEAACGLFKGLSRGGFGCAGRRRAAGAGRWASDGGGALVGSCWGCGPGWGPGVLGAPGGLSHGPARRKKGGWPRAPGEAGCGGGRSGPGAQGPVVPPSRGGQPAARVPARAQDQPAWPERRGAARSPHPRTHSREHAQCGPGNFLPSRERPWPPPRPPLAKLEAVGAGVGGAAPACRPLASRFRASPLPGPRRFSLPPPPRLGTEARMSSPLPEARSQAEWPEAWWRGRLPGGPARGALFTRTDRCREQGGWKGVCERGALGALLAVTSHTKVWFHSCRAVEGRGAFRIVQPLLESHQGARCLGDAGTRRRI